MKKLTKNLVETLDLEVIATKKNQESILNHDEIFHSNQINKIITLDVQRQINQVQTTSETSPDQPRIGKVETLEIQLSHIQFESTNDEKKNWFLLC